jgi:cytochrome c oxidase cbb3-type subunit 3
MNKLMIILLLLVISPLNSHADSMLGKVLYQNYCTQCHGVEGDGYGVNAEFMEVQPRDHTDGEDMMTRSDEDLFKVIKFGGKAIDKSILMPNWDGNLSDDEINSIVGYLRVLCCGGEE